MKLSDISTGRFLWFDQWGVDPTTPSWTQNKGRNSWWRSCTDCTSGVGYFDCLCLQKVTNLHLFTSQLIHLPYVLQLTTTEDSSFQMFYIANKTDWRCKNMEWCDDFNATPPSGQGQLPRLCFGRETLKKNCVKSKNPPGFLAKETTGWKGQ